MKHIASVWGRAKEEFATSTQRLNELEAARYRATCSKSHAFGRTPEEAVHALTLCLPEQLPGPIIVWPYNQGDAFFTDEQMARLRDLRDRLGQLTSEEREELEGLVEASFDASIARSEALMNKHEPCRTSLPA